MPSVLTETGSRSEFARELGGRDQEERKGKITKELEEILMVMEMLIFLIVVMVS